jgi:acetoin:2,6-dichlorophenolindophenol oxidoreductase subunit alpha
VHAAVAAAVRRARAGDGPSIVEVMTYRFSEHSEGLLHAGAYRPPAEIDDWKRRDPIVLFGRVLTDRGVATEQELADMASDVTEEVADALRFAKESPYPDASAAFEDLYTEPIPVLEGLSWRS